MSIELPGDIEPRFWDELAEDPGAIAAKQMVQEVLAEVGPPGPMGPAGPPADMSLVKGLFDEATQEIIAEWREQHEKLMGLLATLRESTPETVRKLTLEAGDILHIKLGMDLGTGLPWVPTEEDIMWCTQRWKAIVPKGVKVIVTPCNQDVTIYRDPDQTIEDRIKQRLDAMVEQYYGNIPVEFSVDVNDRN